MTRALSEIERAFKRVEADRDFRFGVHKSGPTLTIEAKQFIVEMYIRATGRDPYQENANER